MPEQSTANENNDNPFQLPEALAQHPLIKKISFGAPPAARISPGEYYPDLEPVERGIPDLLEHGLDLYHSVTGDSVLFNPIFVEEAELQAIDKAGELPKAVPSYAEVSGKPPQPMDEATAKRRVEMQEDVKRRMVELSTGDPKEPRKPIMMDLVREPVATLNKPAPVPMLPPPTPAAKSLNTQRVKNLQTGGPSSGSRPGQGRIINALTKNTI